ncbi:ABC transporter substrate-binding protein [Roseateles violae]|uniref:ABC transporter substrate-binding protein n=1 Tax=Roseateles violae TaxID=3058042 RepID=A0ABT8DY09_9BURK|nr:ABC transporter substrate-binding protein [Pelomonas sp. PFR6]MDN3921992.1 ABC transporter substrate-binding protein [Pelomonas sp. PFR6]
MGLLRKTWIGTFFFIAMAALPARADIKIGQTAAFTGPGASSVQEATEGARLYFDAFNAQGGLKGQRIELISLDDRYEPQLSAANTRNLIEQGVVAMFLSRGTAPSQAIVPLLAEHRLALVAPSSGAMALREPANGYVFNLRASFQREAERAIRHLAGIGVKRLTIVQVNDEFGNDAGIGALRGLQALNMRASAHLRFDRNKPELAPLMQQVAKANIEAVLLIGPGYAVVEGINALRAAGSTAHVATLSNNASTEFVKALGDNARGVIVTQLFPYERSSATPLVREAQALAKARGKTELTPAQIEGFAAAKLLVEGLKRSAKDLSREGLLKALEGLQQFDLGGLELSFGPKQRGGLDFADVSIIGPDGKFWR